MDIKDIPNWWENKETVINKDIKEEKMKCYIEQKAAQKLKYYVDAVNAEISGIWKSEIIDGDIYIKDVIIFKQTCSSASTLMDDKDQAKVMFKMDKAGESLKDWNVWWHSHSTMGVFWSGTDNNTILEHANNGGYLISIVTNKEGKFKTRIDIFPKDVSPFGIVTYYKAADDIETEILPEIHDPVRRKELASILNVKIDKVEADIKEIEEEYKTKIGEITKELQDEKASLVQKIEFAYDTDNVELEEEYSRLSGSTLIENQILRDEIDKEVEEKVTTPAVVIDYGAYKGKNWWRDKKHSERNFGKNKGLDKFFGIDAGSAFEQLDRIKDRIDPRTENYPHQEYLPSIVKWFEDADSRAFEQEEAMGIIEIGLDR